MISTDDYNEDEKYLDQASEENTIACELTEKGKKENKV